MMGYRQVTGSLGLAKTILQDTVLGRRQKHRLKKRWENSIQEWTGLSFAESPSAAHDQDNWWVIVSIINHPYLKLYNL